MPSSTRAKPIRLLPKLFCFAWALLAISGLTARAQQWVTFLECDIQCDHRDTLTLQTNGNWTYTSGGERPYGLCGGTTVQGTNYQCITRFTNFPTVALLSRSLTNWSAEVISGSAPRCPPVNAGSNPISTVSVIEHTDSLLRVSFRDDGDCGASGRVEFRLRLRYLRPVSPTIVQQPEPIRAVAGASARLQVEGTGGSLSYQWKANGTNVAGATNAVLDFPILQKRHAGSYIVTVSNLAGTVTSRPALVDVLPPEVALRIRQAAPQVVELSWNTTPGLTYRVLVAPALSPPGLFAPSSPPFLGAGPEIKLLQLTSPWVSTYYRIQVDY